VLQLLLSYGANPGVYNHAGCIAVDIAREFGQADVAVRPLALLPPRKRHLFSERMKMS
jgi:hypothetical protein